MCNMVTKVVYQEARHFYIQKIIFQLQDHHDCHQERTKKNVTEWESE